MPTPDCDNGVTVDLENNGGGCGGHDDPAPGVQNPGSPTSGPAPTITIVSIPIVSILLLYYFFFMLYLIGFSKSWWHAALGIAVGMVFLVLSLCLDCATPQELKQLKLDNSGYALGAIILVLYYLFFMFYLVGSSEYWWHAALGIVLVTGLVLLSILLPGYGNYKDYMTPGREHNNVKPLDGDSNDLSTTLLGSRN